jgi:hypothetical protein
MVTFICSRALTNHSITLTAGEHYGLQVLNTDDEMRELKETVIKVFVAAGILETGFTKDSMAK